MPIYHKHHIIPKHIGGTNDPSNLIELTIEEHAEAHRKLWEKYGKWQDEIAWKSLSKQITIEEARRLAVSHTLKGKPKTSEHKAKISLWRKTNYFSSTLGKKLPPRTDEQKKKMSDRHKGKKGTNTGKKFSKETKHKMSLSAKNRTSIVCEKCGKCIPKANLSRHISGTKCFS